MVTWRSPMIKKPRRNRMEESSYNLSYGSFNNVVLVTCGFVLLYVNIELLGIGYVMSSAQCDLDLSNTEKGLVSAAGFFGVVSTAIIWGYLSDRFGRRTVMLPTLILSSLTSILSCFSVNFWMFFFLRILVGCLVSASSATIYAYLGELHTLSHRASAIAWCSTFIAMVFIWVPSLAWLIIPNTWYFNMGKLRFVSWRLFLLTFGMSGLIASAMLFPLPESPSYLLAANHSDKALAVMAKMYAWNKGTKIEDFPVKSLSSAGPPPSNFLMSLKNMSYLTRPPLLRCVVLSHLCMFSVFMLASGMYILMPDILNAVVPHLDQYVSICDTIKIKPRRRAFYFLEREGCPVSINTQIYPLSITMGVLCGATYVVIGYVIGKICERKLFMLITLICAILLSVSAIIAQPHVALFIFMVGLCVGCSASVLAAATVEVFPTNIRAVALCTLYMAGRLGAAVGANILSIGLQEHCEVTILSMCLVTGGFTLLILLWPDPTKVRIKMEQSGFVY